MMTYFGSTSYLLVTFLLICLYGIRTICTISYHQEEKKTFLGFRNRSRGVRCIIGNCARGGRCNFGKPTVKFGNCDRGAGDKQKGMDVCGMTPHGHPAVPCFTSLVPGMAPLVPNLAPLVPHVTPLVPYLTPSGP